MRQRQRNTAALAPGTRTGKAKGNAGEPAKPPRQVSRDARRKSNARVPPPSSPWASPPARWKPPCAASPVGPRRQNHQGRCIMLDVNGLQLFLLGRRLMKIGEEAIPASEFHQLPTS